MTSTMHASTHNADLPGNRLEIVHSDTKFKLVTGTLQSAHENWCEEELQEEGVKLVLVQRGRLRCHVPGQREQHMTGPSVCFIVNERAYTTRQAYGCTTPLRYTIVQLGMELLDQYGDMLPVPLRPRHGDPRLMIHPANRGLQALAAQIATCSLQGCARSFYLGGKALELTALGIELLHAENGVKPAAVHLSASDVERVHAARDILFDALQHPPALTVLAARVGINPRKLTAGFHKVYGASAFALLAEHRLREAHRMLCDEEANISTVAHRVGYSPAHFAVAFRNRYGISPSAIRTRNRNVYTDMQIIIGHIIVLM